jgi:hypothetical protein
MKKQFQQATRSSCKIKLAIQGPSGTGKTYSSLLLAYGLTGDWKKIAVLDTENSSAHLYSELGAYSVLTLSPPYSPENYMQAIDLAVEEGFECVIIDSLSAEWNGQGGVLDIHSSIPGNSFSAWSKVTPRHNAFLQKLLQSDIHVIGTMRSKTDYVMSEKNGKQVPEKVGLKAVQRDDAEYEFTIVFELNQRHQASVSKDRTGLFKNTPELILTSEVGKTIANWCGITNKVEVKEIQSVGKNDDDNDFNAKINKCESVAELLELFNTNPEHQLEYRNRFIERRDFINANPKTFSTNGVHH